MLAEILVQQGKQRELDELAAGLIAALPAADSERDRWARLRIFALIGRFEDYALEADAMLARDRSPDAVATLSWPWVAVWPDQGGAAGYFRARLAALDALTGRGRAGFAWGHYLRALIRRRALHDDSWFDDFAPLLKLSGDRRGWMGFEIGRAHLYRGEFEAALKALAAYQTFVSPKDWNAHAYRGEAYAYSRKPKQALAEFERALRRAPDESKKDALAWKGNMLLWFARYDEARAVLERAASEGARYAFCWLGAAELCLDRPERAVAALDRAVEIKPWDGEAWVWRGEAKRRLGDAAGALADLSRAVEINENPWAFANRALIHAATGDSAALRADWRRMDRYFGLPLSETLDDAGLARLLEEKLAQNPAIRDRAAYERWARGLKKRAAS